MKNLLLIILLLVGNEAFADHSEPSPDSSQSGAGGWSAR